MSKLEITLVDGDLFDQDADVLVNAYNRNFIPWWLLLPQGVSGRLKRLGGVKPFRELAKSGHLQLGQAVLTSGGKLPQQIIHVAGINNLWRASERSVKDSTANALDLAWNEGISSIAFPIIGGGHGGLSEDVALGFMQEALAGWEAPSERTTPLAVTVVRYRK